MLPSNVCMFETNFYSCLNNSTLAIAYAIPNASSFSRGHSGKLRSLVSYISHATNHVESGLRNVIAIARKNLFKVVDRGFKIDERTWGTSEDLSNKERLRQKPLHLSRPSHREFVFFAQLV